MLLFPLAYYGQENPQACESLSARKTDFLHIWVPVNLADTPPCGPSWFDLFPVSNNIGTPSTGERHNILFRSMTNLIESDTYTKFPAYSITNLGLQQVPSDKNSSWPLLLKKAGIESQVAADLRWSAVTPEEYLVSAGKLGERHNINSDRQREIAVKIRFING